MAVPTELGGGGLTLADGGRGFFYSPFANYAAGNLDACAEMIADPNTIIGLGDGGRMPRWFRTPVFPPTC